MTQASNPQAGNNGVPYWIPNEVDLGRFPAELRAAIAEVINPAYHELVERARDGLQKSAGLTVLWLMWLEILDHIQLGHSLGSSASMPETSKEREQLITRHLRLVGSKVKASSFLLRLHEFEQKHGSMPGCSTDVDASIVPVCNESTETED
jgi:hypothetical protein